MKIFSIRVYCNNTVPAGIMVYNTVPFNAVQCSAVQQMYCSIFESSAMNNISCLSACWKLLYVKKKKYCCCQKGPLVFNRTKIYHQHNIIYQQFSAPSAPTCLLPVHTTFPNSEFLAIWIWCRENNMWSVLSGVWWLAN